MYIYIYLCLSIYIYAYIEIYIDIYVCVCSVWAPCVALPSGGGSSAGSSPLCGSPVGGVPPPVVSPLPVASVPRLASRSRPRSICTCLPSCCGCSRSQTGGAPRRSVPLSVCRPQLGLYTILLLPLLYGVWHTNERSEGGSYTAQ